VKSNQTAPLKMREVKREWHLLDADNQVLGRLAEKIAKLLMGKNKVTQYPNLDSGDCVVVTNIKGVKVSGGKEEKKVYYRYSGYPGGLKSETYGKLFSRKPEDVLRIAVKGMLPENKLLSERLARLHIYKDDKYPQKVKFVNIAK